jgi:hypothetical protein
MSTNLGPIEIDCDSPPYSIVEACRLIGIESPEDVRWCRVSRFLKGFASWQELFDLHRWKILLGLSDPEKGVCACGEPLPRLEKYGFTKLTGDESFYLLGQCRRCHTIFWEDAEP